MNNLSKIDDEPDFRVTDPLKKVRLHLNPHDRAEIGPITVPDLMKRTTEVFPNHPALMYEDANSKWNVITYKEYRERAEKISKVFIKLGLESRGVVAVLAFNSVEWFIAELAAIYAG